jgi:hypothetical protein
MNPLLTPVLFPDVIGESFSLEPRFQVVEQEVGEAHVVRYRKSVRPRYVFNLGFSLLTYAEAKSISDVISSCGGGYERIHWFSWHTLHWLWVPIGVGNGTTTLWDIPGKLTTEHELRTGTGTVVGSFTITPFDPNVAGSVDRVAISPAVANGVTLWANFRGRRRFTCLFESGDQPMPRQADTSTYSFNTQLIEVK